MAHRKHYEATAFDTLSYAKKLQAAGFTQEQAEVQAETFLAIVQEQLVSKRDLKEVEKELSVKIEDVRKELKVDIEKVRYEIEGTKKDLKIWFGGMLVVAVTVLSGMMTLIVHLAR